MERSYSTLLYALSCAFVLVSFAPEAYAQGITEVCRPDEYLGEGTADTEAIQTCLDKGKDMYPQALIVTLECRTYLIDRQLELRGRVYLRGEEDRCKPVLLAAPTLRERILFAYGFGYGIWNTIFDGNGIDRLRADEYSAERICDKEYLRPANLEAHGKSFTIAGVETRNAPCGSGLGILAEDAVIMQVRSERNGFRTGREFPWADGITVIFCNNCRIVGNDLIDNTDISLVLGGGASFVTKNTIMQKHVFAFCGLCVGRFDTGHRNPETGKPWDGYHKGSVIEDNTVTADRNMLMYGLMVGSHAFSWEPKNAVLGHAGTVRANRTTGAQIPFAVDGIEDGSVYDNRYGDARGDRTEFNKCKAVETYIAGHFGKAYVQGGFRRMTIDYGVCVPQ